MSKHLGPNVVDAAQVIPEPELSRVRRPSVDPAVAALLGQDDQRQAMQIMTPAGRRKWKREQARTRATYDLPQALLDAVRQVGEQEALPNSAVVAALVAQGLHHLQAGTWSLEGAKSMARSPLFEYLVDEETVLAILTGKLSLQI
jgi:ABC-type branched-subunit amino acid transport system substrate-binding protein